VIAYDDLPRYLKVMADGAATRGVDAPETDAHAGGLETSQMKFLRGVESVDMDPDLTGYVEGEEGWLDILLNQGIDALSPIGVLGDPSISTATAGEAICAALADELAGWIASELGATLVNAGVAP
jgi:creatinine amidohydrolase